MFAAAAVPLVVSGATLHVGGPTECCRAVATAVVDSLGPPGSARDADMTVVVVVESFAIAVEVVGWQTVPDGAAPWRFSETRPGSN